MASEEIDAINALDEALSDADAIITLIFEGLEHPAGKAEPVHFSAENLRRVCGVVFDLLKKAEGAAGVISSAHTARVSSKRAA